MERRHPCSMELFAMMEMPSWIGMTKAERKAKAEPFKEAIKEHFKLLKTSRTDVQVHLWKPSGLRK